MAQAHRLYRPDRDGGRALRILSLRARRRRARRRHLQHRRLEPGIFRQGAGAGHDGRRLISARAASTSSSMAAVRSWSRAARATRRSSSRTSRRPQRCRRPPACAPPWRRCGMSARAASRSRRPIRSGTTTRCRDYLERARLRDRARRRHGCAVQGAAERHAGRHREVCRRACSPAPAAATRSTCPARNGRRRRPSTRWSASSGIPAIAYTHASFLRRLQGARHRRTRSAVTAGCSPRCAEHECMKRAFTLACGVICLASPCCQDAGIAPNRSRISTAARPSNSRSARRAAGGYDVAGRTLANHMSRHIPGNPDASSSATCRAPPA